MHLVLWQNWCPEIPDVVKTRHACPRCERNFVVDDETTIQVILDIFLGLLVLD